MDLDGAPYGGAKYPAEAATGGRTFVKFHLDAAAAHRTANRPQRIT